MEKQEQRQGNLGLGWVKTLKAPPEKLTAKQIPLGGAEQRRPGGKGLLALFEPQASLASISRTGE